MPRTDFLTVLSLVFPVLLSGCIATSPSRSFTSVPAGYVYEDIGIIVHPPASDGWLMTNPFHEAGTGSGIGFGKHGSGPNSSLAAQVFFFTLASTTTKDELIAFVKQGEKADVDSGRFELLESTFEYSEERGYPCVKITSLLQDKQAKTSSNTREVQLLDGRALYCKHPNIPDTGFFIGYSHRGQLRYPSLDAEAQGFIEGVQVPGK
jgi:hypothetical protein